MEVDVDPLDFYAIDDFRLTELATAAARVYAVCLMGRAMIGLEYPGREKKVWAKLVKLDYIPPLAGQSREGGLVRPLGVLDDGTTLVVREGGLQEASRNTTVVESQ